MIEPVLHKLGLSPKYHGYHAVISAVALIQDNPERLSAIIKEVYMDVGKLQNRPWYTVERNIRSASNHMWKANPELLAQLAGRPLKKAPSNSELLILLYYQTRK